MSDYRLEIINNQAKLNALAEHLPSLSVVALDIETIDWWDRFKERIALIQIAFRTEENKIKVAVVDTLAKVDLEALRGPLESKVVIKAVHNASFDAGKLFKHYKFKLMPVFDTMTAARRNGEKKYSLAAQAATHLNLRLDKTVQRSDWSRRPLDLRQIDYAARDAFAALLLYENQTSRNLAGNYQLKNNGPSFVQGTLDLTEPETRVFPPLDIENNFDEHQQANELKYSSEQLSLEAQSILSIVNEMPDRFSPERLAVSVGSSRVGLAGWIIDRTLGRDADFDEETAKIIIGDLFERKLIRVNEFQSLQSTTEGVSVWEKLKILKGN